MLHRGGPVNVATLRGVTAPENRRERLMALRSVPGKERRALRIGPWEIALSGLEADLASALDRRWGGFVGKLPVTDPSLTLELFRDDSGLALGPARPGEHYRLEADSEEDPLLVRSHFVACCPEDDDETLWRAGITKSTAEALDRTIENAVRYLVARLCVKAGGFALHGAGVLRDDRVHIFAGPSRSGKTTAVGLSPGATSLGDDFSVVIRVQGDWRTVAVPFDNAERAPATPPAGLFPIAAIWRLVRAQEHAVETLPPAQATATLMGCAAFPWAMPDLAEAVLEHVAAYVAGAAFGQLRFKRTPEFWSIIEPV